MFSPSLAKDKPFPWEELAFENLEGQSETLEDYRGRIVVVNFWATWCAPCRRELPLLVRLQEEYGPRGVQLVAVSRDLPGDLEAVRRFVAEYRIGFPVWVKGTEEQQVAFRLATALPATAVLDRDGELRFRIIGEAKGEELTERLDWLLSQRNTAPPAELLLPEGMTAEHFREHETGEEHSHEEESVPAGSEVPS